MLEHGGRIDEAAKRLGIPRDAWLDLSTGINPNGYLVPTVSADAWHRLPEHDADLCVAACRYYGANAVLPVAGTQAAIRSLPRLRERSRVVVLPLSYNEHAYAWKCAGHHVITVDPARISFALDNADVLIVVNPNNPTGEMFAPALLRSWHERLTAHGGWMIVDEAYMDATPDMSLAPACAQNGLIILRSLGKFFGLAGARVGFALGDTRILELLAEELGPWAVSGPAQSVARAALEDARWQAETRAALLQATRRLRTLLNLHGFDCKGTALFQWISDPRAHRLHERLCARGILTRRFEAGLQSGAQPSARIGLPGSEPDWQRLAWAIQEAA